MRLEDLSHIREAGDIAGTSYMSALEQRLQLACELLDAWNNYYNQDATAFLAKMKADGLYSPQS